VSQRNRLLILVSSFLIGVWADFLFNGVLKIVWVLIYGATYFTLAALLYSSLHQKYGDRFGAQAGALFLAGCLMGHLVFVGRRETRTYSMSLIVGDSRIVLRSPELSQTLYVASEGVLKALAKMDTRGGVLVTVQLTKDYGCVWSFKVSTVAGVDVMNDPESSWVWKKGDTLSSPPGGFSGFSGLSGLSGLPGFSGVSGFNDENSRKFWCQIRWF
jgi:hypothetical protein